MRTPVKLLAVQLFDKELRPLQDAAKTLRQATPRSGWVNALRTSLGMSTRAFARRLGARQHRSVIKLESNEMSGAVTIDALRRAADALQSDFVYAIIPRKKLSGTISARARELAQKRLSPIVKSMALEKQGLSASEIDRQVSELARELEQRPGLLWR